MQNVLVRPMAPEDAGRIHTIHTRCLTGSLLGRYTRGEIDAWLHGRTPDGYLRAREGGERFIVAETAGEVVGFASWADDELWSLFVDPDHQGQGIGSTLMAACLADAERHRCRIEVVKSVVGAHDFYARFGFAVVERGTFMKRGVALPEVRMRRHAATLAPARPC